MKLITQTNRNFSVAILIVLPISCVLLFFSLNYFISEEVDEKLRVDELRIEAQLKLNPSFISMAPVIEVTQIEGQIKVDEEIRNVLVYDPIEKENEPFRELMSVKQINGNWYLIKVRHSTIENKDFILVIGLTMIAILLMMFSTLFVLNHRLSLRLWKPFYTNMDRLKSFSFTENELLELEDSKIDEFQDLKASLVLLTNKLRKDYRSLKEFTENASHETQTPLAIISINLEEILQEEHSEVNYKKIYACYQSVQKLSKLNERLLLLAKLDNNQFNERSEIDFNALIHEKVKEFEPLFEEANLHVILKEKDSFIHEMDALLANMLIVNLVSNAVKYAKPDTSFVIEINAESLRFSNETELSMNPELLFERFKKGNDAANSTGLGLSIVKRVIEVSNLKIEASVNEGVFAIWIEKSSL